MACAHNWFSGVCLNCGIGPIEMAAEIARLTAERDIALEAINHLHGPLSVAALTARAAKAEAERDTIAADAFEAAARRIIRHEKGTPMHSPPQMLTEAHDAIMALPPADARAAREARDRAKAAEWMREAAGITIPSSREPGETVRLPEPWAAAILAHAAEVEAGK